MDFGACPHLFRINPNDALYAFRLAVIDHLFQTLPLIFISLFPETPTVVDQVILPAQACSGIVPNLLLFKLRGLAAPPLPKHAARFHPVKIAGRIGRRAKIGQQVAVDQSVQIVCHDSRTPRGRAIPLRRSSLPGLAGETGRIRFPSRTRPISAKSGSRLRRQPITVAYNRRQRIDQCFACGNILKHRLLMQAFVVDRIRRPETVSRGEADSMQSALDRGEVSASKRSGNEPPPHRHNCERSVHSRSRPHEGNNRLVTAVTSLGMDTVNRITLIDPHLYRGFRRTGRLRRYFYRRLPIRGATHRRRASRRAAPARSAARLRHIEQQPRDGRPDWWCFTSPAKPPGHMPAGCRPKEFAQVSS